MKPFHIPSKAWEGWKGYASDKTNAPADMLSDPSVNAVINENGIAEARLGYEDTGIDLSQPNKAGKPFYMERFNITFIAIGTKVYYIDHNSSDAVRDTGITFTDGTVSRFEEYAGQILVTNATDGARMIAVTQLNGAVSAGAASIVTKIDGAARADRFDTELLPGTKYLRINGTNEQYSAIVAATGTFTLSGTASQSYTTGTVAIVVYDVSSRFPKCSKMIAWKESINCIGVSTESASATSDVPPATVHFTQFVTASTIESMVKLTGGASGTELVGKSGLITNAVATKDYLYLFKENETYFIPVSGVNTTTGARPPQILSTVYGCMNEDCAAEIGDGEVVFLTKNKRLMRIKISTTTGAAVVFPDESFDVPMRKILDRLDSDQTGSHIFYHKGRRRLYCQLKISSQWITLVYDGNIKAWQPPQTGKSFSGYFERQAIAYACDSTDDTIYKIDSTYNDNGSPFETWICSGEFVISDAKMNNLDVLGDITQQTTIHFSTVVNGGTAADKQISGSSYSYGTGSSLGSFTMGSTTLAGDDSDVSDTAEYRKTFDIYPSDARKVQMQSYCFCDSGWYSVKSYSLSGSAYRSSSVSQQ